MFLRVIVWPDSLCDCNVVTFRLLEAEKRKLAVLQRELGLHLSGPGIQKRKEIDQLKRNICRIQQQYDQLEEEYKVAAMGALRRTNQIKRSSRSQPAIGLKQTPKSRPTIFGTIAQDKAPTEDRRRQSVGPQTLSLSQMFDMEKNGFDSHIRYIDETDALIFQDGNLLSGSLEALIQHLVPTGDYYPDRTYIFAFLLSSRLFIRPHNLLGEVCQVCIFQQNLANDRIDKNSLGKFGTHIVSLLSEWTELFPYDFRDERMMKHLKDITQRVVKIYPELRKDISALMHNLLSRLSRLQKFEDVLAKLSTEAMQKSQTQVVPTTDIMEVCPSPLVLAQQLTHVELERLSMIGAEEFVQAFSKEVIDGETTFRDMKKTTNLEAYVQWFNRLSYLVASEICSHLKKKNRVKMIEYFIDVAKECINIGNFNSLMAIIAGMNMSPVARLKKTWAKVNTAKFLILEHQMDPSNNFGSYRSCLKAAMWRSQGAVDDQGKIVVPFFSLFVKDLYFLNEGCMNRLSNTNINFEKFWQVAKQISDIMAWQQVECPFEKSNKVLNYVLTSPVFSETTLSLASYECEPPENSYDKERHKTLKAQAGL
ncbi:ras-GEF domain-containing family member 1B-like isoform X1 [Haliotis rufescens]|uniref:ras-GEF domain-containing family member 1B-like isoform X1 n=1 Tax=Haliotis rufescens TaxID=6454 RepID=UPI001EB0895A|nr:ras-GEF domain-containing family member 1B-like isoform X1 [Haliotis rufescens]